MVYELYKLLVVLVRSVPAEACNQHYFKFN